MFAQVESQRNSTKVAIRNKQLQDHERKETLAPTEEGNGSLLINKVSEFSAASRVS